MEEMFITIEDEFITLGQLLKIANIISSGGMAKWYLSEYVVYLNDEEEQRRGKKIHVGDRVTFPQENLQVFIRANE